MVSSVIIWKSLSLHTWGKQMALVFLKGHTKWDWLALNESDFVSDERMSKCPHRRVDRWETFGWSILLSPSHTHCGLDAVTKAVLEIWISVT